MSLEAALALAGTLFIVAIIPGPGVMAVTGCALGRGSRAALAMTGGVIVGDMVYLTLAVFGLAVLAQNMGELFMVVRLAGAAYLIWLGVRLWRAPAQPIVAAADVATHAGAGLWRSAGAGLAVTLGNPKTIAFYLGLLPTFIDLATVTTRDFGFLSAIVFVVIGSSVGAYAVAAGRMRALMRRADRVRAMNRTAGTIMVGTGVALAAKP